jgi:hypothetical protein
MDLERSEHDCTSHGNATKEVMFSSYFLEANMDDEDIDTQQLPEDAFHHRISYLGTCYNSRMTKE